MSRASLRLIGAIQTPFDQAFARHHNDVKVSVSLSRTQSGISTRRSTTPPQFRWSESRWTSFPCVMVSETNDMPGECRRFRRTRPHRRAGRPQGRRRLRAGKARVPPLRSYRRSTLSPTWLGNGSAVPPARDHHGVHAGSLLLRPACKHQGAVFVVESHFKFRRRELASMINWNSGVSVSELRLKQISEWPVT